MTPSLEKLMELANMSLSQVNTPHKSAAPKVQEKLVFEKVLNELIAKELLAPMVHSSLFANAGNYGYLLQNSLTSYLSDSMHLVNIKDIGVQVK